ncbi:olfactory receptor 51G2-like [Carettochelys insculpta]|uniref:olfactory receptor 51G2-like n=1 Tax=Carettochelys insculpta TaxID=44489 RepID=UPI003EC06AAD
MSFVNDTKFNSVVFFLTGIPGLKDIYLWISVSFCVMYAISIVGNSVILFTVKTDPSLHEPMYIFLSMLAISDIGLSMATMPTILSIFLFNAREMSLSPCFTQLFFIHFLQCTESAILLLMAFDRFIAICNPLRYTSVLTLPRIPKMGLVCVLRGLATILPLPLLLTRYQYCRASVLSHSYCLHQDVMKMACSDIKVSVIYGLFAHLLTMGLDFVFIFLSYAMILKNVLSVMSPRECLKALNTCVSHLCAVLLFYTPDISLSVIHRFGEESPLIHILLGYMSLVFPPLLNPIVYCVKSKQLRERIIRLLFK